MQGSPESEDYSLTSNLQLLTHYWMNDLLYLICCYHFGFRFCSSLLRHLLKYIGGYFSPHTAHVRRASGVQRINKLSGWYFIIVPIKFSGELLLDVLRDVRLTLSL